MAAMVFLMKMITFYSMVNLSKAGIMMKKNGDFPII